MAWPSGLRATNSIDPSLAWAHLLAQDSLQHQNHVGTNQTVKSYASSRLPSPPVGCPTANRRFTKNKHVKKEITHGIFIHRSPNIPI